MKSILHKADTRGTTKIAWLDSWHSFSFGDFQDEKRIHFGALRVLNDDIIAPAKGFGTHPHRDMEIITIPLSGSLKHKDSTGTEGIIKTGDVQIMSAGTGIYHSEFNASPEEQVRLLQIWIFPKKHGLEPRYDQKTPAMEANTFNTIVTPDPKGNQIKIFQQAWLSLGEFQEGTETDYLLQNENNGLYIFNIEGDTEAGGSIKLFPRDAAGIWKTPSVHFRFITDAKLLLIEVPLTDFTT